MAIGYNVCVELIRCKRGINLSIAHASHSELGNGEGRRTHRWRERAPERAVGSTRMMILWKTKNAVLGGGLGREWGVSMQHTDIRSVTHFFVQMSGVNVRHV